MGNPASHHLTESPGAGLKQGASNDYKVSGVECCWPEAILMIRVSEKGHGGGLWPRQRWLRCERAVDAHLCPRRRDLAEDDGE